MKWSIRGPVLCFLMLATVSLADDPLPTAEEIALHLRQYQSSIKTLQVRYRTRQQPLEGRDAEGNVSVDPGTPWREYL